MDVKDLRKYLEAADACCSGPPVKWGTQQEAHEVYDEVNILLYPFWSSWENYHYGEPPDHTVARTKISRLLRLSDDDLLLAWSV